MNSDPAASITTRLRLWDALLLWTSLLVVVALAWAYLFWLARDMSSMDMAAMPAMRPWGLTEFILMFLMWAVMMVGMMVPSAARAVAIYSRIAVDSQAKGHPIAATYWFVAGYVLIWTGFSLLAAILQGLLTAVGLMSPMMVTSSVYLGAGLLIAAGLYQLTPWKDTCLRHCQSPVTFLAGRFSPRVMGGIKLGAHHGAYCLGCCWLLMSLLFVGGVMNLLWIAAITVFVLLEKLLPSKLRLQRISAVLMIGAGLGYVWLL